MQSQHLNILLKMCDRIIVQIYLQIFMNVGCVSIYHYFNAILDYNR